MKPIQPEEKCYVAHTTYEDAVRALHRVNCLNSRDWNGHQTDTLQIVKVDARAQVTHSPLGAYHWAVKTTWIVTTTLAPANARYYLDSNGQWVELEPYASTDFNLVDFGEPGPGPRCDHCPDEAAWEDAQPRQPTRRLCHRCLAVLKSDAFLASLRASYGA